MNYDELKGMIMKKVDKEIFDYKQELIKNKSPEEIIKEAYEINFKDQIRDVLDSSMLGRTEMKVLLKTDNVIGKIYDYWVQSDGYIWDKLEDRTNEKVEQVVMQYKKDKGNRI